MSEALERWREQFEANRHLIIIGYLTPEAVIREQKLWELLEESERQAIREHALKVRRILAAALTPAEREVADGTEKHQ